MKVKHPFIALIVWFGLGAFALTYGIQTVAYWIVFCFGAVGLYTLYKKHVEK